MAKSIDVIEAYLKFLESDSEEETLNVDAVEATKRTSRTGVTSGHYNPENSVLESILANVPESVTSTCSVTDSFSSVTDSNASTSTCSVSISNTLDVNSERLVKMFPQLSKEVAEKALLNANNNIEACIANLLYPARDPVFSTGIYANFLFCNEAPSDEEQEGSVEPSVTSPAKEPLVYPGDYTESLTALAAESHLTESDYLRIKVRRNFI